MECEHKKDKYGCVEGCKEYFPIIPRESIVAEMELNEEYARERGGCRCKKICDKCGLEIKSR